MTTTKIPALEAVIRMAEKEALALSHLALAFDKAVEKVGLSVLAGSLAEQRVAA